ncbi:uncharacterized protein LY89DRAFT_710683 [Mollisia scopiformis]|uniref:Zn(2)-C6 fungal-type domain-containing protein n=1 Tax=Mollisia scopiformis TaxID=149040 RepID=A0A132BD39_MOLSC|nr:uncharacterized protein LY89DRAFT_710683 [Mollisia scopiformis]KUJ10345.1 hypothetical protein LY89DRAFT_710683 [Mollisia scopiformis]
MGRKPNFVILQYFDRGQKLNDSSNRYEHTCKSCGEHFPKGRSDRMTTHLGKCTALSPAERQKAVQACNNQQQLPDGVELRNGQLHLRGPTVDLPIAPRNWTPLETLAEASRQIGLSEKHDGPAGSGGRSSEPPRADRLELQEQYTLDNPPVSYEQRVQGRKFNEKLNRRESNHSLPPMSFHPQMVDSRSSSPNPNLAMAASSMAAAARFVNAMVDPQLLNEGTSAPEGLPGNPVEQTMTEATGAYSENPFQDSPVNQHNLWSILDMGNPYHEAETVDKGVENNELPRTTYTQIAMNPAAVAQHEFSAEYTNGERPQKHKVRGRFTAARRKEVQEVRKKGACIRCRMLKKPCSGESPCVTCASVESARLWKAPCVRTKLSEELEMYSSNLHVSLAYHETNRVKNLVSFRQSANSIEASQYPAEGIFATFNALYGQQMQTERNVDPDLGAAFNPSIIRILDENNDDLPSKLEAYMKRISPVFYANEQSHFMRVTLATAHALAMQKEDALLSRALELWSIVHILVDHEMSWTISERTDEEAEAGRGPLIDQVANGITFNVICLQLNAAAEKKAATICKSVLNDLERRLLQRTSDNAFETFLTAIVMLNCVEKSTWLYKSWEQESFQPRWPLDKTPEFYASQGDKLTNMLHMLLKMRSVPPKTFTQKDGLLASEAAPAQEYFEQLQLKFVDVLNAQANHSFDPSNPGCYELRFCSQLLLPSQ